MAYTPVDPRIGEADINPADRNAMAIQAGYTGYEDYLNNRATTQQGGGGLQSAIQQSQQIVEPAAQAMRAEKEPLKERYEGILKQILSGQERAETRQTLTTGQEMGKRGILPSSGFFQQEMTRGLEPITREYTGMYKEAGTQRESDLRAIDSAIAQLYAQAGQAGMTAGLTQQQNAITNALERARQALQQRQYEEVTLPESKYAVGKPHYKSETGGEGNGKNYYNDGFEWVV